MAINKTAAAAQTTEQLKTVFMNGLKMMEHGSKLLIQGVHQCAPYIVSLTTYKDQSAAIKQTALAYQAHIKSFEGRDITIDSGMKWVSRKVKADFPEWKKAVSETPQAKANRKARVSQGKDLKTGLTTAQKKAAHKPVSSEAMKKDNWQDELVSRIKTLETIGEMFVPSGKLDQFRGAFAAFLSTLEVVIK